MITRALVFAALVPLLAAPPAPAQDAPPAPDFWQHWGDGKAELSGYRITTSRYGKRRQGQLVLIYVTEPMDRRTWIKDDGVAKPHRVEVLKLNAHLAFRTGIYPYSVLTSVFAPISVPNGEPFSPAKVSLSAQEWCGHVYQSLIARPGYFEHEIHSYFASEGDQSERVSLATKVLYEDALLIQLRELNGPFAGSSDWSGQLVPTLWSTRKSHQPPRPRSASIRRSRATSRGVPVTRFLLTVGKRTRIYDVERTFPRRIVAWQASDGEQAALLKTTRLPYWRLNNPGDESYLKALGL